MAELGNTLLEIAYVIIGLQFLHTAYRVFKDTTNPARLGTTAFWGLLGVAFVGGSYLPSKAIGVIVLLLAALTLVKQVKIGQIPPIDDELAEKYNVGQPFDYHRIFFGLNGDFDSFKNNLKQHCVKDWIFFIDADETLNYYFAKNLHEFLEMNKGIVDVISVPRVNKVNGLTEEHIYKWRWFVDDKGWVNWPDYQTRICANKKEIVWINKVHERLSGFKTSAQLPALEEWSLTHIKDIDRQEKQNNFYNTL